MGKRRKSAKTGDKALYKKRDAQTHSKSNVDNDNMFNEVDRFHNRRDEEEFLELDQSKGKMGEEDDGVRESVLDLGVSDSSDEDDDESDGDRSDEDEQESDDDDRSLEADVSSDSDDDMDELEPEDVRDWGLKKSAYYHGDTADLEIGQEEDDAFLEEEAAKEVQAARYDQMDEDDFMLSDAEEEKSKSKSESTERTQESLKRVKDVSKLTRAAQLNLLNNRHPELLPLVSHFGDVTKEWQERTNIVCNALLSEEKSNVKAVGATKAGVEYLLTKSMLQTSSALNLAIYLLLKMEQAESAETDEDATDSMQSHPVLTRLQLLNEYDQRLQKGVETKIPGLEAQITTLSKAAGLVETTSNDDGADATSSIDDTGEADREEQRLVSPSPNEASSEESDEDEDEDDDDETDSARNVLNEARFALRPNEVDNRGTVEPSRKRRPVPLDFGDEDDAATTEKASKALASTINTIQQRSATKERKRNVGNVTESLDYKEEDNSELRRGLEMMEAELGRQESDDDNEEDAIDDELEDDYDNDFYQSISKKSKAKKEARKALHQVAPKYPGMEQEVEGERAISKAILKNRGLVAHKAKINRNPRVKKREQYRKALIRRKGKVREVRTNEGHKYAGEQTGIKSGLSRSRKLGVR